MKSQRNTNLDVLRGALLIIMTIDHFSSQVISYYFSFFSAAEGFVFISGIVMGIYGYNKYKSEGYSTLKSNLIKRSIRIYKYHICTFLVFLLFTEIIHTNDSSYLSAQIDLFEKIIWGSLLVYKPSGTDILPMYIVFVLISPVLIKLIVNKRIGFILAISSILWFLNYTFIESRLIYWFPYYNIPLKGVFSVLSWQFIFILGVSTSFLIKSEKINNIIKSKTTFYLAMLILIAFLTLRFEIFNSEYIKYLTSRNTLGPLRILNFISFAYIVYYLISKISMNGRLKAVGLLGQYSIQVFTFHLLILIIFQNYLPFVSFNLFGNNSGLLLIGSNLFNWILTLPSILLLFIPVFIFGLNKPRIRISTLTKAKLNNIN